MENVYTYMMFVSLFERTWVYIYTLGQSLITFHISCFVLNTLYKSCFISRFYNFRPWIRCGWSLVIAKGMLVLKISLKIEPKRSWIWSSQSQAAKPEDTCSKMHTDRKHSWHSVTHQHWQRTRCLLHCCTRWRVTTNFRTIRTEGLLEQWENIWCRPMNWFAGAQVIPHSNQRPVSYIILLLLQAVLFNDTVNCEDP